MITEHSSRCVVFLYLINYKWAIDKGYFHEGRGTCADKGGGRNTVQNRLGDGRNIWKNGEMGEGRREENAMKNREKR